MRNHLNTVLAKSKVLLAKSKALYAALLAMLPSRPKRHVPTTYQRCLAVHLHFAMHNGALNNRR